MTTTAAATAGPMLENRRFAVRFLGRRGTWLWLLGTGVFAVAAWMLVALPARGVPSAQRSWYLWSGNAVLVLFLATMAFVARKVVDQTAMVPRFRPRAGRARRRVLGRDPGTESQDPQGRVRGRRGDSRGRRRDARQLRRREDPSAPNCA